MKKIILAIFISLLITLTTFAVVEAASSDRIVFALNDILAIKENKDAEPEALAVAGTYFNWDIHKEYVVYMTGAWSGVDATSEIYIVDTFTGESQYRVTDNTVPDSWPDWSQDGMIAWHSKLETDSCPDHDTTDGAIWISDDFGETTQVIACGKWEGISFSPDGTQIVSRSKGNYYNSDEDMQMYHDLYIIDVDRVIGSGQGITRITIDDDITHERWPDWSSYESGDYIAYIKNNEDPIQIYVLNANTGGIRQLTGSTKNSIHPTWSPDNARIMFSRKDPGYTLYSIASYCDGTTGEVSCDLQQHPSYMLKARFPSWGYGDGQSGYPDLKPEENYAIVEDTGMGYCIFGTNIHNLGLTSADSSHFKIDVCPDIGTPSECYAGTPAIAAQDYEEVTCGIMYPRGGYNLAFTADVFLEVHEYNENNNYWGSEPVLCDPVIPSWWADLAPGDYLHGDVSATGCYVTAEVDNLAAQAAGDSKTTFRFEGTMPQTTYNCYNQDTLPVPGYSSVLVTCLDQELPLDEYRVYLTVDSRNTIVESDEDNNYEYVGSVDCTGY